MRVLGDNARRGGRSRRVDDHRWRFAEVTLGDKDLEFHGAS
jgi:hypothetical protein